MFILGIFLFAIVGVAAGLLSGLLGISGGVITVPALLYIFKLIGLPQAYVMYLAIGTSLAAMVLNSISSTWYHNKKKSVLWKIVKDMAVGIVIGSFVGALVADYLSGVILEIIFGFFALFLGLRFLFSKKQNGGSKIPGKGILGVIGFIIGTISNILGIGGGVMTVPVLMHYRVPETKAIGTSAATGTWISFLGAVSYLGFGFQSSPCSGCIGYLYLPAFIIVGLFSFFAAPFGGKLAHVLPSMLLKKIFAVALIATGLVMLFL